jgi:regulator of nonsense transcripts 2
MRSQWPCQMCFDCRMAQYLDVNLQELPGEDHVTRMTHNAPVMGQVIGKGEIEKPIEDSPFEDDETRAFYEKITDIKQALPLILFSDIDSTRTDDREDEVEEHRLDSAVTGKVEGKFAGMAWQSLIAKLSECNNLERVDELAMEFCYLNSKGNRRNLVQILAYNERSPVEMVPYYARLAVTLIKAIPEMESLLIAVLEEKFKNELSGREAQKIQNRIYTVSFLSELVKFGVYPASMIFNCIRILLDDFTMPNVQVLCRLLESCGRYLYRHRDSQSRMVNMLEILLRKRSTHHLDARHQSLVDDAYFSCRPPEKSVERYRQRSPLLLYIEKLLFSDLDKKTVEKTFIQFQKMPWTDLEMKKFLVQCFCKPWKIKYNFIRHMADILSRLVHYYSDFTIIVIDNILESIRLDLETYTFKRHQKQISVIKYLGELYNYGVVNDRVIFNTLYTLITFGHEQGHAAPNIVCPIDPPEDCFRIKLVCTLLETCGEYFDRGLLKKRLDIFLVYFQVG